MRAGGGGPFLLFSSERAEFSSGERGLQNLTVPWEELECCDRKDHGPHQERESIEARGARRSLGYDDRLLSGDCVVSFEARSRGHLLSRQRMWEQIVVDKSDCVRVSKRLTEKELGQ